MTVQTNTNVANFLGNGAATYPIGFKFNSAADLVVQKTVIATGVTTTLTLNSDYSVAGAGVEEGGSITFSQAPTSAESIKVTRVVDLLQLTDLRNQGKFYAEVHEEVFDKLVMIDQQQQTEIDDANAKSDEAVATANSANAKSDQAVEKAAQNLVDMQAQYNAFEQGAAFVVIGDYAAGLVVDGYNKVFRKDGELYRASASLDLPYTLTGNWATESVNFVSVGDGVLRQELANATDPAKGAGMVGFRQAVTGVVARTLLEKARELVSVKDFGAVGDGVTDDTAAIQSAINAMPASRALFFPAGIYKVSAPILIQRSDITLYGESNTSTYILRNSGTYGDTITVASTDPDSVAISGVVIRDMRIQANADMDGGAHIHLVNVAASFFTNLTLMNGYRGFWLEGVRTSHFTTTLVQAGTYAASARVGSAYVFIGLPRTAALENTELFFSDFNWEYAGTARRIENGIVIQECDGVWFSNGHVFGASNAGLYMQSSASSDQILAAIFDHVWFDQQCDRNLQVAGSGALFGLCRFSSCRFTGADSYNVLVSASSSMQGLAFIGCEFGVGALDQSVDIFSGNNVSFNGCRFEQIDSDSSSTSDAYIVVRGTSTLGKLAVAGCTFVGDAKLKDGIKLLNSTTEYTITGNTFVDFSTVSGEEIYTDQTVLTGSLSGNVTDRTFSIAATAGTQYVTPLCSFANLTGASVNITAITPKWNGREISFRADTNAKTLEEGAEILSESGGDINIPVGRVRSLIYSRAQNIWYQKG